MGDIRLLEGLFNLPPVRETPKAEDLGYDSTQVLSADEVDGTMQMCVGPNRRLAKGQWIRSDIYTTDVAQQR